MTAMMNNTMMDGDRGRRWSGMVEEEEEDEGRGTRIFETDRTF